MSKMLILFVFSFVVVFSIGFLTGYFLDRTSIVYTHSQLDELRLEIENMQLQEMFISIKGTDCKLLYSSMGKLSYDLNSMVNALRYQTTGTIEFEDAKIQADLLSLRAWMLARNIKESCTQDLVPILFIYSTDSPDSRDQDAILQNTKGKYEGVLVYSIDFNSEQPAIRLVRDAYEIGSAPAMIISDQAFGQIDANDLESEICKRINCSGSTT